MTRIDRWPPARPSRPGLRPDGWPAQGPRPRSGFARAVLRLSSATMAELILGPVLRYVTRRRRRSGSRPTRPARSRCSGAREPHVLRRGPSLRARPDPRTSSPAIPTSTRWRSTASGAGREHGSRFPPSVDPHDRPGRAAEDRVRLVPRRGSARAALHPDQGRGQSTGARSMRSTRSRLRMRDAPRDEWPQVLLCLGDQVYADEDSPQDARVHPLAPRHRASRRTRRCSTSRSTRACTGSRGATRRSAGCFSTVGDGDDLRRPRRPRRLEHVRSLGRGDAGAAVVGGADQ